jgi:hypothetical protein
MLVATALVLACALGGCGEATGEDNADPDDPVSSGAVGSGNDSGCPDGGTPVAFPADGQLPEGAAGVRLCNANEQGEAQFDLQVPADELTTDVDGLVALVNTLPQHPDDEACTFDAGPDLIFWFRYPDAEPVAVRYAQAGCRTVFVGADDERSGGEDLHAGYAERLAAQRQATTPPDSAPPADCEVDPPTTALDIVPSLELATAALCRSDRYGGWKLSATLTEEQIQQLNEDWDPQPAKNSAAGCSKTPLSATRIIGYTSWGDLVSLYGGRCGSYDFATLRQSQRNLAWQPSPEVIAMLETLFTESRSRPVN